MIRSNTWTLDILTHNVALAALQIFYSCFKWAIALVVPLDPSLMLGYLSEISKLMNALLSF